MDTKKAIDESKLTKQELRNKRSMESGLSFEGTPKLTQQSHKDLCDINKIIQKLAKGENPAVSIKNNPIYGDYSNHVDYAESLNLVMKAEAQFMGLDAKIRSRFQNDPAKFLAFCNDPKNNEEMVSLGLAFKRQPEAIQVLNEIKSGIVELNNSANKSKKIEKSQEA